MIMLKEEGAFLHQSILSPKQCTLQIKGLQVALLLHGQLKSIRGQLFVKVGSVPVLLFGHLGRQNIAGVEPQVITE